MVNDGNHQYHQSLIIINKMMFYGKTPYKYQFKQDQLQPWNAEESNMLNLIIESAEANTKVNQRVTNTNTQLQKNIVKKEPQSFNFHNNLRKYEKKKAQEFIGKKQVNFIERNIKGVSQDFMFFNEQNPSFLSNKLIQEKHKKNSNLYNDFASTIQPVNWSFVISHQQNKQEKKYRHKAIQNFLRFQSQKIEKAPSKGKIVQQKLDNAEPQGDKYQKLLKLRQGLRKRNLKSASQSRKIGDNSLNIEQNVPKQIKLNRKITNLNKKISKIAPQTSQSMRNTDKTIKVDNLNDSPSSSPKNQTTEKRLVFTSHNNRLNASRRMSKSQKMN